MFSSRVPEDRRPNRLSSALSRAKVGRDLINLTLSNPTRAGIRYPPQLLDPLGSDRGLDYAPDPLGDVAARQAVSEVYAARGVRVPVERIALTSSTSEAYSLLFKLLCDPGTAVLAPVPSYPLFDHLTQLEGVAQRSYRLAFHGAWSIDWIDVDRVWTERTRAVLVVSPNNPTGSVLTGPDAAQLMERCVSRQAGLIVDEVFAEYPLLGPFDDPAALASDEALVFRLGGLSKTAGLPQVKLGWIAVGGPDALVEEAMDRLELVCDTYLSVSTPVQLAVPALLRDSGVVRDQIRERIRTNYAALDRLVQGSRGGRVSMLPAEGGWSAVLRVPATIGEERLALDLLDRGVVVHPGFFFDFPHEAFIVVSLLPEPLAFEQGVRILLECADAA
ncbi:MAG TPA: pyridoxal phosphate-dependent aminotransferase [Vicinamibacterales bacterium]|jgi:alanine-synthesizing transaminase|nr:pyridoxal phosphate-dependent aminotransferase [Vicinamibacterales bacterium]